MSYSLVFGLIFVTLYHVIYENVGNWSELQAIKQEGREKDKVRKEKLAGYFFDLSKLSFAGLVIGVVIPLYSNISDENNWYYICTGIILSVISALLANKILK